ncbi:SDR family oxidoreductase [Lentzea sp. CA-135723]|uniref:SDR family oxidoreductase n=1 Tax=Lentzea sp. CA-135723 TaxID=3239950 RepID=UPI003D8F2DCB
MGALDSKVALVTGGSRGIGAAVALRLAREGADVALTYTASEDAAKSVAEEITALGRRALVLRADQADPAAVDAAVRQVAGELGRLDILVNSAGVTVGGPFDSIDLETSDRQIDINYRGVRNAVRSAAAVMADHGRIINISTSTATGSIMFSGFAEYSATKAAVTVYSKGTARDLGGRGITVNVIQPGPIATDMNPDEGEFADLLKSRGALGRYGTAEEVAALAAFLAGPEAGYITGSTFNIDGGLAA